MSTDWKRSNSSMPNRHEHQTTWLFITIIVHYIQQATCQGTWQGNLTTIAVKQITDAKHSAAIILKLITQNKLTKLFLKLSDKRLRRTKSSKSVVARNNQNFFVCQQVDRIHHWITILIFFTRYDHQYRILSVNEFWPIRQLNLNSNNKHKTIQAVF